MHQIYKTHRTRQTAPSPNLSKESYVGRIEERSDKSLTEGMLTYWSTPLLMTLMLRIMRANSPGRRRVVARDQVTTTVSRKGSMYSEENPDLRRMKFRTHGARSIEFDGSADS